MAPLIPLERADGAIDMLDSYGLPAAGCRLYVAKPQVSPNVKTFGRTARDSTLQPR